MPAPPDAGRPVGRGLRTSPVRLVAGALVLARLPVDYARHAWEGLLAPALSRRGPATLVQAVVREQGRVLLAVRDTLRGWELPGGGPRPGEPAEDALRREVHEETGLDVVIRGRVGTYVRSGFRAHVAHVFACDVAGGTLRPSPETPELGWFDPAALPDTIFPWFRGPLDDALATLPGPVERAERQGVRAILAGARIDLRMRVGGVRRAARGLRRDPAAEPERRVR